MQFPTAVKIDPAAAIKRNESNARRSLIFYIVVFVLILVLVGGLILVLLSWHNRQIEEKQAEERRRTIEQHEPEIEAKITQMLLRDEKDIFKDLSIGFEPVNKTSPPKKRQPEPLEQKKKSDFTEATTTSSAIPPNWGNRPTQIELSTGKRQPSPRKGTMDMFAASRTDEDQRLDVLEGLVQTAHTVVAVATDQPEAIDRRFGPARIDTDVVGTTEDTLEDVMGVMNTFVFDFADLSPHRHPSVPKNSGRVVEMGTEEEVREVDEKVLSAKLEHVD